MAKVKKSKAKKAKTKKSAKKKARKSVKRAAAKARRAPARKSSIKKSKKAVAKKSAPRKARKAAPRKKQKLVGEGDYAASKTFLKEQADFVKRNKDKIPQMGREAEKALDGPEGAELKAAEQEAMNRSMIE